MQFDKDGQIVVITDKSSNIHDLVSQITESQHRFNHNNVVINLLTNSEIMLDDLIAFLKLSNAHRAQKHSFVIVTDKVDFDEVPDELVVVPTLQYAYDIIEMEEMERDLGL